ncbi:MAG: hypothetical protein WC451_03135 [Patescibacteria group bacterium]|jgi:hypothetical protein
MAFQSTSLVRLNNTKKTSQSSYSKKYEEAIAAAKKAISVSSQPVSEYQQAADLYAPGGSFGAGQRQEIESSRKRDLAASYGNLVKSGMWSGSSSTGAQMAAGKTAQQSVLNLEDLRYSKYASALEAVGAAKTVQHQQEVQAYQTLADIISGQAQTERSVSAQTSMNTSNVAAQMQKVNAEQNSYDKAMKQAEADKKTQLAEAEKDRRAAVSAQEYEYAAAQKAKRYSGGSTNSAQKILKTLGL